MDFVNDVLNSWRSKFFDFDVHFLPDTTAWIGNTEMISTEQILEQHTIGFSMEYSVLLKTFFKHKPEIEVSALI